MMGVGSILIKQPPTILDIEASGFGSSSFPIEIGVKRADGARFCKLIKPYANWHHWDETAAKLHGITRGQLDEFGVDGRTVCLQLNDFLQHSTAYSDGWVVDHPWLIKLYAEAGIAMSFRLSALEYILSEKQMQCWHEVKKRVLAQQCVARHRASVDAELIQQTFVISAASGSTFCALAR